MEKNRGSLRVFIEKVKFKGDTTYSPFVTARFGSESKQTALIEDVRADVFFNEKLIF